MARYIGGRILSALVTLLCITVIIFCLLSLVHGTPLGILPGETVPAGYAAAQSPMDPGRPVLIRYLLWLRDVLHGDLGQSLRYHVPVDSVIAQRIGPSLLLSCTGVLWAVVLALPIGTLAAYWPHSLWDRLSSVLAIISATFPRFTVSIAGIYIFAFRLQWFPAMGMYLSGNPSPSNVLHHLFLPASIVALGTVGLLIRQTRSACLEVFQEDYIKAARARGLSETAVVIRHGLRSALTPVVTQIALEVPGIISGATILEKIFGWPGIGSLMIEAIFNRDYPLVMGVSLMIAFVVLSANIVLDILYALLDPRVTHGGKEAAA